MRPNIVPSIADLQRAAITQPLSRADGGDLTFYLDHLKGGASVQVALSLNK